MLTAIFVIVLLFLAGFWCNAGSPLSCSILFSSAILSWQAGRILNQLREMHFDAADDS